MDEKYERINVALAGNANVGKSLIFNQLTGMSQIIGNWPGKTVTKAEGYLIFKNYKINIIDLPGIYSLSTYSLEEIVSREYIALEKPDIVVNVVDASLLERNLFFTIQLLELGRPMILVLNLMDVAEQKGISIDARKLEDILGVPVIKMVARTGQGITELVNKIIEVKKNPHMPPIIKYGKEIEREINHVSNLIKDIDLGYPTRWVAIKILENDSAIIEEIKQKDPQILERVLPHSQELEAIHGEPYALVMTAEKYTMVNRIAESVITIQKPRGRPLLAKFEHMTTHPLWGFLFMLLVIGASFFLIFVLGNFISSLLDDMIFSKVEELLTFMKDQAVLTAPMLTFSITCTFDLSWVALEGLFGGIGIVLPFVIPFYIVLAVLEDSGYLTRIAFLMDNFMHRMGLHGKAFIPMILGYGCNVPGCLGCRIMETQRERLIAAFATSLVPCAAVTVVILGLLGPSSLVSPMMPPLIGFAWAGFVYLFNLLIVFIFGRIAFKAVPGEPSGLIMEMHSYRMPSTKVVLRQTWFRTKDFIYIAFPFIIISGVVLKIMDIFGLLSVINLWLSPVTMFWLGLPPEVGLLLILGVLRKELFIVQLEVLLPVGVLLTPGQAITISILAMFYVPCIATIAVLIREFGYKKALLISAIEVGFAIFIAGIFSQVLRFIPFYF
ncbi:MAG: ferrous iron transport protein B [Candidatus Helarchaeales archaeon]